MCREAEQDKPSWKKGDILVSVYDSSLFTTFDQWFGNNFFINSSGLFCYINNWKNPPAQSSCANGLEVLCRKVVILDKFSNQILEFIEKPMETKPKIYILLKDTPVYKAGTEYEYNPFNDHYRNRFEVTDIYLRNEVESNPEWFKLKEEKEFTESDMEKAWNASSRTPFRVNAKDSVAFADLIKGLRNNNP